MFIAGLHLLLLFIQISSGKQLATKMHQFPNQSFKKNFLKT